MDVQDTMVRLGGVASRATLLRLTSRAAVDRALRSGTIRVMSRGRYVLPQADLAVATAHDLSGVVSHSSAALLHGWELKLPPPVPHVTVPRKRHVAPGRGRVVHFGDLDPDGVDGHVTGVELTLTQCLRTLPFDEALAVADSALRHGIDPHLLTRIAADARGPGAARIRRVAREARAEAANPFESVLRAIALDVPGLHLRPQVGIVLPNGFVRPDLVDVDLRIVVEADSFTWHGSRAALRRDARRYNALVIDGWLVLRFSYEDVMHDPEHVRAVLIALTRVAGQAQRPRPRARRRITGSAA